MSINAIGSSPLVYSAQAVLAPGAKVTHSPDKKQVTASQLDVHLDPIEFPTRKSLVAETASFSAAVNSKFQDAGISMPPEAVLSLDGDGKVRVANDHPDRARIEQVFQDNPELRDQFSKISAQSSILRAADGYEEFAQEYEGLQNNPEAQAALVQSRIAHNSQPFYLTLNASGAEGFFAGLQGVRA